MFIIASFLNMSNINIDSLMDVAEVEESVKLTGNQYIAIVRPKQK